MTKQTGENCKSAKVYKCKNKGKNKYSKKYYKRCKDMRHMRHITMI